MKQVVYGLLSDKIKNPLGAKKIAFLYKNKRQQYIVFLAKKLANAQQVEDRYFLFTKKMALYCVSFHCNVSGQIPLCIRPELSAMSQ